MFRSFNSKLCGNNFQPIFNCYFKTAGCILIGNEILNGSVKDANLQPLAKLLFSRGITLKTVNIIGDDEEEINDSIQSLRNSVDYIFTSGGIGSTSDDITYEAIANAYNDKLVLNKETEYLLKKAVEQKGRVLNEPRRKMCKFPSKARILHSDVAKKILLSKDEQNEPIQHVLSWVPLVVIETCYILPGVPHIFKDMLKSFENHFPCDLDGKIYSKNIYFDEPEGDIAELLTTTENKFKNNKFPLTIGSYPELIGDEIYHVRVNLQSSSSSVLDKAENILTSSSKKIIKY